MAVSRGVAVPVVKRDLKVGPDCRSLYAITGHWGFVMWFFIFLGAMGVMMVLHWTDILPQEGFTETVFWGFGQAAIIAACAYAFMGA